MEKKVILNTNVQNFKDVQRSLSELSKEVSLLKELINVTPAEKEDETEGLTGSIRVIKNSDSVNLFEIKTDDGWKKPMLGETQILLKKLQGNAKIVNQKSIDEIEAEDTDTDNDIAKKTIFDEKAGKFVLPRPDYDSGWVDMANTDTTGTHDLESVPILGIWQVSNDSGTTVQFERVMDGNDNSALQVTSSVWRIYGNNNYGFWANGGDSFTAIDYTGYKARVLLWK
jgi:hypothetical protein|tara:strand:- start:18550 stop:19230 length:681 start_codon:yes stop_codon:yes gene_type:complete